jgi:hypothetical protein
MVSARDGRWLAPGRVVGNARVGRGISVRVGRWLAPGMGDG